MKTINTILGIALLAAPLGAQELFDAQVQAEIDRAMAAAKVGLDRLQMPDMKELQAQLEQLKVDDLQFQLGGLMAFAPQDDRAREAADRAREARDRAREAQDRVRDSEDRNIQLYRDGTSSIDDRRYEHAIERFDRVIDSKWSRSDGAYYWKAYALNKLGKRDEALVTLGEISKQFPQSRWINDAKALQVEIQQAAGTGGSPESQSDEDLKLIAINSLVNSEPDRAVPLLEKVINDSKNNLGIKGRALYVLAQIRSDKAHDIVAQYAKSGANQDLQIRAVQYLGAFRSKDSQQTLADVYAANNDLAVRRAVLRSMMTSRDAAHLFNAAKSEQNVDLRREAIRDLGMMRASAELGQLYSSESNPDLKETIIESIWMGRDGDKLMEIAKNEKDARLRGDAIVRLGQLHETRSADGLASMYAGESDKAIKTQIVNALWQGGACKQLVETMRAEKDAALKTEGVRRLGMMKGCKEATDYLMELITK